MALAVGDANRIPARVPHLKKVTISTMHREAALAESLLARVKLAPDRHRRRPTRLSGGEQQRVAIARALANDPPLILANEPTANLDSTTGEEIVRLLRSLASGDRTVLIATHDTSIARQADLVITMRDGKFVRPDSGPPGD